MLRRETWLIRETRLETTEWLGANHTCVTVSLLQEDRLVESDCATWSLCGDTTILVTLAHVFNYFAPLMVNLVHTGFNVFLPTVVCTCPHGTVSPRFFCLGLFALFETRSVLPNATLKSYPHSIRKLILV